MLLMKLYKNVITLSGHEARNNSLEKKMEIYQDIIDTEWRMVQKTLYLENKISILYIKNLMHSNN